MGLINVFITAAAALGLLLIAPSTTHAYAVNSQPHATPPEYHTIFNNPTATSNPPKLNGLCAKNVLEWLAEGPIPDHCTPRIAHQASAFCRSYLQTAKTTTTVFDTATITLETIATITETSTSRGTQVATTTLTTLTTSTSISTTTTTSPTSTFTTTSTVTPGSGYHTLRLPIKARQAGSHQGECPDLTRERLAKRLGALLDIACACLGIHPGKKTSTSTLQLTTSMTITKTQSTTTTTITIATATSASTLLTTSTTTTTTITTTTSPVVATTTTTVNPCDVTYNGGGITPGNTVFRPENNNSTLLTGRDCCITCFSTPNCVASAVGLGYCQLLIKNEPLAGASTSPQCPLGIESYPLQPGPGTLYLGPCGLGVSG